VAHLQVRDLPCCPASAVTLWPVPPLLRILVEHFVGRGVGSTGVLAQGFMLAKKVIYHLSQASSPFALVTFE
jgi:hypothetical protein